MLPRTGRNKGPSPIPIGTRSEPTTLPGERKGGRVLLATVEATAELNS
jgi:hypothetical protein